MTAKKNSHEQKDTYTHLGAVKETPDGLVVRGAKMLATLAPVTDEVIIYSFPGFAPGDEKYALAFAIPIDTPGLRIICREPMQDGQRSFFDHPLASRFEEMDALLVFDDVVVPWDRVFLYNNVEADQQALPNDRCRTTASTPIRSAWSCEIRVCDTGGDEGCRYNRCRRIPERTGSAW